MVLSDPVRQSLRSRLDQQEVEELAKAISDQVWRKVRAYIRRQQRELHDLIEED